jgi:hypothetical protein
MSKSNPWYVPPIGLGFDGKGGTVSDEQSHSIDLDDDPELVEAEARMLRDEISSVCVGKTVGVVTVAVLMMMGEVLKQYPKRLRKTFLDASVEYLLRIIK